MGLVMAIAVSIPLAMYSARHQGGWIDRVISAGTFGVLSVPSFLAGLLLIMVMVNYLGWFPRSQWCASRMVWARTSTTPFCPR